MSRILQLFIDLKIHTVPLKSESGFLERLPNGSKTIPNFEKNYREVYAEKFNTKVVPLAGALTGELSNIIAIDCDNDKTFELFKNLDPTYKFHFYPIGKEGGTILYKYTKIPSFSILNDEIKLDLLSDNRFIYLPTENNKTKIPMHELPCELKPIPESIQTLLKFFSAKLSLPETKNSVTPSLFYRNLNPLVKIFVSEGKFTKDLFKIITPVSFRNEPQYLLEGTLNPNKIKEGSRSNYLSRISAIFGADPSINPDLYRKAIELVNRLLKNPLEEKELASTIIFPMMEGRARVNGVPIWKYDENWKDKGYTCLTMKNDFVESFFDDVKQVYFLINHTTGNIFSFSDKKKVVNYIKSLTGKVLTEQIYDSQKRLISTVIKPELEFGHTVDNEFNLFKQNQFLNIINNPEVYEAYYKKPVTILRFLKTFIPHDDNRNFLLSFIKTKFKTFAYSPIILYFLGVPGSGKDTFVSLLNTILGENYCERPDYKVFLEKMNRWIENAFLIHCDEYGDKLGNYGLQEELMGRLKSYTGSSMVQIRGLFSEPYSIKHRITFILTSNKNALRIMPDDRRFFMISTPNKLTDADWVKDLGGISIVIENLRKELKDFCYYLGTEIKDLSLNEYVEPPINKERIDLIINGLNPLLQIQTLLEREMWDKLLELAEVYNIPDFTVGWEDGRLYFTKIGDLYEAMTNGKPAINLRKALVKISKFSFKYTTTSTCQTAYLIFSGLKNYVSDFESTANTDNADQKTTNIIDQL